MDSFLVVFKHLVSVGSRYALQALINFALRSAKNLDLRCASQVRRRAKFLQKLVQKVPPFLAKNFFFIIRSLFGRYGWNDQARVPTKEDVSEL